MALMRDERGDAYVRAAPFVGFLHEVREAILPGLAPEDVYVGVQSEFPGTKALAALAGCKDQRQMYRYLRSLSANKPSVVTDRYRLSEVDKIVVRLGKHITDVYGREDLDDLPAPEPYQYCGCVDDAVTPIHGMCPWCERLIVPDVWKRYVIARELIPRQVVLEAAFAYQQGGANLEKVAETFAPRTGMTLNMFVRALRDEFYALGVRRKYAKASYRPQVVVR